MTVDAHFLEGSGYLPPDYVGVSDWYEPVITALNNAGADALDSIEVTVEESVRNAQIHMTNTSSVPLVVTSIIIDGEWLRDPTVTATVTPIPTPTLERIGPTMTSEESREAHMEYLKANWPCADTFHPPGQQVREVRLKYQDYSSVSLTLCQPDRDA